MGNSPLRFLFQHYERRAIFEDNLEYFAKHNAEAAMGQHSYTVGVGPFADLTHQEFIDQYTTSIPGIEDLPRTPARR